MNSGTPLPPQDDTNVLASLKQRDPNGRLNPMRRTTGWIVDRPVLTMLIVAIVSVFAVAGYQYPEWPQMISSGGGIDPVPPKNNVDTQSLNAAADNVQAFSLDAEVVLVIQSENFFNPQSASALREIAKQLQRLEYVEDVIWMDLVPMLNIFGLPEPIFPHSGASPNQFQNARNKALDHPFIKGQLLSADGTTLLMLLRIDALLVHSDDDCTTRLKTLAQRIANDSPGVSFEVSVTGWLPMFITAMQTHEQNQFLYQLIGYSMIAVMALILFRGFSAVLIIALAPAVGVFWTMGFVSYFQFQSNPFNEVVLPVLVSLVGLTDGVHLMVQIRRLRSTGMPSKQAAKQGLADVGLACALTSLTTAIGFGSLTLADHTFVQQFGQACVVGVGMAFLAVVTTIPLACCSRLGHSIHLGLDKSLVDQNLSKVSVLVDWVLAKPRGISRFAIVATIALIGISLTLRPDDRRSNALPLGSDVAVTTAMLDQKMGGIEKIDLDVRWDDTIEIEEARVIQYLQKLNRLLADEDLISNALSICELIEALPGDRPVEQRLSMVELLPPPLKKAFYQPDQRKAKIIFRVEDLGIQRYSPVFERIETGISELRNEWPEFHASLSGDSIWRWRNLYQIVVDLATSLGVASLIIFIVLALVFRSLRIGLISIVPNLFPLAVAGTWLALTGQSLEVVTVCAFTVCLGIAVDDTIHFLTRYLAERQQTDNEHDAIHAAFTGVGTALIMTTVVLVAGFSTVMLSDSRDHFIFATMGAITLTAALFADLVLLPALLKRFMSNDASSIRATRE